MGLTTGALWLPEPPSVNRAYRRTWRGVELTDDARLYQRVARLVVDGCAWEPHVSPVAVRLTWHRTSRRGDVDNVVKLTLDALQARPNHGRGAYWADSQVLALVIARRDDGAALGLSVECVPVSVDGLEDHAPGWARAAVEDQPADPPVGWRREDHR